MKAQRVSTKITFLLLTFLCLVALEATAVGYFKNKTPIARVHAFSDFAYFFQPNKATISGYTNLAKDNEGNIYIADYNANRIRKYNVTTGVYSVIAGEGGLGDGALAFFAFVDKPAAICLDAVGNIYFTEKNTARIRKIDKVTGIISTYFFASSTIYSSVGFGLCFSNNGRLYFTNNFGISSIDPISKTVRHEIGAAIPSFTGIINPIIGVNTGIITSIAFDKNNILFFIDNTNQKVYKANFSIPLLSFVAGSIPIAFPYPYKDSIDANNLKLEDPASLCFDQSNNLLMTDNFTGLLYKIDLSTNTAYFAKEFNDTISEFTPPPSSNRYFGQPQGVICDARNGNTFVVSMSQMYLYKLNTTPSVAAPTVASSKNICQNVIDTLTAIGDSLNWYRTAIGNTNISPIVPSASLDTLIYFVSQTIGGEESERAAIVVRIFPTPQKPIQTSPFNYCYGNENAVLTVSVGTNMSPLWFNDSLKNTAVGFPKIDPSQKGKQGYFVIAYDAFHKCGSESIFAYTEIHQPDTPITKTTVEYCQFEKATTLQVIGENIKWYSSLSDSIGSNIPPIPQTNRLRDTIFYITQTDSFGCESEYLPINVFIHPNAGKPDAISNIFYCQYQTADYLKAYGFDLKWYLADSTYYGTEPPLPSTREPNETLYFVSQKNIFGCESPFQKIVVITQPKPKIYISQKGNSSKTGEEIILTADGSFVTSYLWNNGQDSSNNIFKAENAGRYYFWAIGTSEVGCKSDTVYHFIDIDSSIYWDLEFKVYPNPFTNKIKLSGVDLKDIMSLNLYNSQGQLVVKGTIPLKSLEFDIPDYLPVGNYFLEINTIGSAHPTKMIFKE